jgi:hypothetical protein
VKPLALALGLVLTLQLLELGGERQPLVIVTQGDCMRCLGKLAPKHDPRTLHLRDLLVPDQLPPPAPFDWAAGLPEDLGVMRNDRIGLCTVAAIAHLVQMQTGANGQLVTISDDEIEDAYKAITLAVNGVAFTEDDPMTDTGLCLLDVLNYVRAQGLGAAAHGKGLAFVKLAHDDAGEVQIAGRLFGGVCVGAQLPNDAEGQLGGRWTPTSPPGGERGTWGGHAMALHAATPAATSFITWGKRQYAGWDWCASYVDEMYALISSDWVTGDRPAPSGFAIDKLRIYLAEL